MNFLSYLIIFTSFFFLISFVHSNEDSDKDDSSDSDEDDEDDDEKELQAELERIRAERAAAQARKLQEEKDIEDKLRRDSALKSNPLLTTEDSSAKVIDFSRCTAYYYAVVSTNGSYFLPLIFTAEEALE